MLKLFWLENIFLLSEEFPNLSLNKKYILKKWYGTKNVFLLKGMFPILINYIT